MYTYHISLESSTQVLDNANTLATYNIKPNCSLHLVVSKNIGAGRSSAASSPAGAAGAAGAPGAGGAGSSCPPAVCPIVSVSVCQ